MRDICGESREKTLRNTRIFWRESSMLELSLILIQVSRGSTSVMRGCLAIAAWPRDRQRKRVTSCESCLVVSR